MFSSLKPLAISLNLCGMLFALVFGLAGANSDTSPLEQRNWALLASGLSLLNAFSVIVLIGRWKYLIISHAIVVALNSILIIWSGKCWWDVFWQYGTMRPPLEAILYFFIGVSTIAALAVRRLKSKK